MSQTDLKNSSIRNAYIITGPTSGIGRATAMELAKYGTLVLVARDRQRLDEVKKALEQNGQRAVSVVCDLSNISSVRHAATEIIALNLQIVGLLNNAGIRQVSPTKNVQGWDMTFATNHLAPFALTEALVPHISDGGNVVFVASAVEDPERKPATAAGFRGGRYITAEASARGEWKPGGSKQPGFDAYATSKQAVLASAMALAREMPRLHFNVVEPGVTLATGLGRDSGAFVRFLSNYFIDGEYATPQEILAGLTLEQVTHVPAKASHSIYEELWHVTRWQTIMVFRDEALYELWVKGEQYPTQELTSEQEWQALVRTFFAALDGVFAWMNSPERLKMETDPGITMADNLTLLALHNAYHLGKIVALRELFGPW